MSAQWRTFFNRIDAAHWRTDLRGGLAAAAVALPLALAFGVVSGAGPAAGLAAAVAAGLMTAFFGGTPTQIAGPTGPMAIVMAGLVAGAGGGAATAFTVVMLAGLMQIGFGVLRLGRYIALMPSSVTSGFATAVGCIIIIMQLNPLLGHPEVASIWGALAALPGHAADPRLEALLLGLGTFLIAATVPASDNRILPAVLLALVTGTAAAWALGLEVRTLADLDTLGLELRQPVSAPDLWEEMLVAAAVVAVMSSIDSLLTSVAADTATQRFHDSNRELVGQGLGNLFAGFIGAIPSAGATSRTMTNIRAGGRTPLSAVAHSGILLAAGLAAWPLILRIPQPVLAGILIHVGLGIIDWPYLRRLRSMPPSAVVGMLTTLVLAVFVSVITGVVVGVIIASLVFVKHMADLQLESIHTISGGGVGEGEERVLSDDEARAMSRCGDRALLIHLSGPISFGAANGMTRKLANVTQYDVIILDLADVPEVDSSAAMALESIIRRARDNNETVILSGLKPRVARFFVRFGIIGLIRETDRFQSRRDAIEYAAELLEKPGA